MPELPPTVSLVAGELPFLAVGNRHARAKIYLNGGHVASWRPAGEGEILWMSLKSAMSPGKALRGGVPICFPWFGVHADRPELPGHGFARLRAWSVLRCDDLPDGRTRVVMGLGSSPETLALWPHAFALTHTVTVGPELDLALQVENRGSSSLSFEAALHTYFDVGDVRRATIEGLAGAPCIDTVQGRVNKQQGDKFDFAAETDRTFPGSTASCIIDDPILARRITVGKRGSQTTVVWNPWVAKAARMPDFGDDEWPGMLCIEAANAGDDRVTLQPGDVHVMGQTLAVGRLSRQDGSP